MWNVVVVSFRQRITPDHLLGRVNAGFRLLAWGTMPIGAGLAGIDRRAVRAAGGVRASAAALVATLLFVRITDADLDGAEPARGPAGP